MLILGIEIVRVTRALERLLGEERCCQNVLHLVVTIHVLDPVLDIKRKRRKNMENLLLSKIPTNLHELISTCTLISTSF
jgi:hypothetical protein